MSSVHSPLRRPAGSPAGGQFAELGGGAPGALSLAWRQPLTYKQMKGADLSALTDDDCAAVAANPDYLLRVAAARNPTCPPALQTILADDDEFPVVHAIAQRNDAPAELLSRLASDEMVEIRTTVATNGATPANTLRELAADPCGSVRVAVSFNDATPPDVMLYLMDDNPDSSVVLECLAANESTPREVLERIAAQTICSTAAITARRRMSA